MNSISLTNNGLKTTQLDLPNKDDGKNIPETQQNWKDYAIKGLKIAGVILVSSLVVATVGHGLTLAGTRMLTIASSDANMAAVFLRYIGTGAQLLGKALYLAGKYAFLSISVPAYTIGWVAPKWFVMVAIPKAAVFANAYVFTPLLHGVMKAAAFIHTHLTIVAKAVYQYAIKPLFTMTAKALTFVWHAVVLPVSKGIAKCAEFVVTKLGSVAQIVHKYVLEPLFIATQKAFVFLWKSVVVPLANGAVKMGGVLKESLLKLAQAVYTYALNPLGNIAAKTTTFLWNRLVLPAANATFTAANHVFKAVKFIFNEVVVKAVTAFHQTVLHPMLNATVIAAKFLWNASIIPIAKGIIQFLTPIAHAIAVTAQAIYNFVLLPLGQVVGQSITWTARILSHGAKELYATVCDSFTWIATKFA